MQKKFLVLKSKGTEIRRILKTKKQSFVFQNFMGIFMQNILWSENPINFVRFFKHYSDNLCIESWNAIFMLISSNSKKLLDVNPRYLSLDLWLIDGKKGYGIRFYCLFNSCISMSLLILHIYFFASSFSSNKVWIMNFQNERKINFILYAEITIQNLCMIFVKVFNC